MQICSFEAGGGGAISDLSPENVSLVQSIIKSIIHSYFTRNLNELSQIIYRNAHFTDYSSFFCAAGRV